MPRHAQPAPLLPVTITPAGPRWLGPRFERPTLQESGEGPGRNGGPSGLTWGAGARSWQPVEGSDAEALRERRGPRVWCFGGRHAHPVGPWLSSRHGWTRPVVSTPRWDPYHCYFRRLLRAPPCRSRRGTALSRLRSDASRPRRPVTPPTGRGGLGGGGATENLWEERTSLEVSGAFACSQPSGGQCKSRARVKWNQLMS